LAIIDRRELGERAASHALQALAKRERPALAVEQRARCLDVSDCFSNASKPEAAQRAATRPNDRHYPRLTSTEIAASAPPARGKHPGDPPMIRSLFSNADPG
jgi:hypothetical protein